MDCWPRHLTPLSAGTSGQRLVLSLTIPAFAAILVIFPTSGSKALEKTSDKLVLSQVALLRRQLQPREHSDLPESGALLGEPVITRRAGSGSKDMRTGAVSILATQSEVLRHYLEVVRSEESWVPGRNEGEGSS